jgi:uncharacterized damage-inducible protein DinB
MKLDELFSHWRDVRSGLLDTIDSFTDEDLSHCPYPDSWSVGEIMLHIANAEDGWFRFVVLRDLPGWPSRHTLQNYPTIGAIKELLNAVHARTEAYLATLELDDLGRTIETPWGETIPISFVIWHVLEHEIHHRGELSLILGLLGRDGLDV